MQLKTYIPSLLAFSTLVLAAPPTTSKPQLRLIKTSEQDPGSWVTEEDKISKFKAKHVHFIDITDITDTDTLKRLNGSGGDDQRAAAVVYPTTVSHQSEANALIKKASTDGPKSWLKSLTE